MTSNNKITVKSDLKKFYDEFYNSIDKNFIKWRELGAIDKVRNIISLCKAYSHNTILEIGSGEGAILDRLSRILFGAKLYSLEISQSALKAINKRRIKNLIEINLFDGYNIPYPDNKFDLVILSHVVEHLEYPYFMIKEASRVAEYIFVEVPLENNIFLKKRKVMLNRIGHNQFFSKTSIQELVRLCRLKTLNYRLSHPSFSIYKYLYKSKGIPIFLLKELLEPIPFSTHLFSYNYSFIAKKE